jgi:hypothetical protein
MVAHVTRSNLAVEIVFNTTNVPGCVHTHKLQVRNHTIHTLAPEMRPGETGMSAHDTNGVMYVSMLAIATRRGGS